MITTNLNHQDDDEDQGSSGDVPLINYDPHRIPSPPTDVSVQTFPDGSVRVDFGKPNYQTRPPQGSKYDATKNDPPTIDESVSRFPPETVADGIDEITQASFVELRRHVSQTIHPELLDAAFQCLRQGAREAMDICFNRQMSVPSTEAAIDSSTERILIEPEANVVGEIAQGGFGELTNHIPIEMSGERLLPAYHALQMSARKGMRICLNGLEAASVA